MDKLGLEQSKLIIFFATEDGNALNSQQKQALKLIVALIMSSIFSLKLKKVGKTTRPFRYDLNQILYDYMVEVTIIQGIRSDRQSA